MKILVLNGSPRGESSNTMKLTRAFLEGMNAHSQNHIDIIDVSKKNIAPCLGCFSCWNKTPGECVLKDDMEGIRSLYLGADLILWSFPLYYFGMPSKIKALMDRLLPFNLPFLEERSGRVGHPSRYDMSGKRCVLISTCGFYSVENNYDALFEQFRILYGEKLTKIICPESELFRRPELSARTGEYLSHVRQAGAEYAQSGRVSTETAEQLSRLLYPPKAFIEMANASWGVNEEGSAPARPEGRALTLMRQMAAIYAPRPGQRDIVLEFFFIDTKQTFQLLLGKEDCKVRTEGFTPYTTRIETPLDVWIDISRGKISGPQAMLEHRYRTVGDFSTMLKLGNYFGHNAEAPQTEAEPHRKTNMGLLLMPWIVIWVLLSFSGVWGGAAGVFACALAPLAALRWSLTPYDRIGAFAVSCLSLAALLGGNPQIVMSVSYFLFGALWLGSCFLPIPLSAWYSKEGYGGDKALKNALFVRTNRILTLCWGVLYLLTTLWTYVLIGSPAAQWTWLINSACPALMGLFTAWFQKWYPARVARA